MVGIKLVRFVDIAACKWIFSNDSTFVLGLPAHYRNMEGSRRDVKEGIIEVEGSRRGVKDEKVETDTACTFSHTLISCWTILDKEKFTTTTFQNQRSSDRPVLAFVSTPDKVQTFLEHTLDIKEHNLFFLLEKDKVSYCTQVPELPNTENYRKICFKKKPAFRDEKEYRFVVHYDTVHHTIDRYTFTTAGPALYCDEIFFNPNASCEDTKKLFQVLNDNGHITNYADLLSKFYACEGS